MGGLSIKSVLLNTSASLISYQLDAAITTAPFTNTTGARVCVVDVGYSQATASIFDVSTGGIYSEVGTKQTEVCTAKTLINLMVTHCVKDFKRKCKMDLSSDKRAMLRLHRECEIIMKMLSSASEANMTIDALYEGLDYTTKISRAKFEDIGGMQFMKLRNFLLHEIVTPNTTDKPITNVCIVGGLSNVPKIQTMIQALVGETVEYPKLLDVDSSEVHCLGAAYQGGYLTQQNLLESGFDFDSNTKTINITTTPVYLTTDNDNTDWITVFSNMTTDEVPTNATLLLPTGSTMNTIYTFPIILSDIETSFILMTKNTKLCEVVCPVCPEGESKEALIKINLKESNMIISIMVKGDSISELDVPLV